MNESLHDSVVERVTAALQQGRAVKYCDESPDNQYPEITWQIFGLIETNEIAVIARCGELRIGACRDSPLLSPAMADRIFGIDVADQELAMMLSDEIWTKNSERLIAEALKIRSKNAR